MASNETVNSTKVERIIDLMSSLIWSNDKNSFLKDLVNHCAPMLSTLINIPPVITLNHSRAILVGDIHGQIVDMCKPIIEWLDCLIIDPNIKLIFLGDIPDRGPYSIECVLLTFVLRCEFPNHVYYIRGNHEERCVNVVLMALLWKLYVLSENIIKMIF